MAKTKPGKKELDSYTIKGTNKVVKGILQICVLIAALFDPFICFGFL